MDYSDHAKIELKLYSPKKGKVVATAVCGEVERQVTCIHELLDHEILPLLSWLTQSAPLVAVAFAAERAPIETEGRVALADQLEADYLGPHSETEDPAAQ